jgi:hypothetical protein
MMTPPEAATAKVKTCSSYIRSSSGKQATGNGADRQLEFAPRLACG